MQLASLNLFMFLSLSYVQRKKQGIDKHQPSQPTHLNWALLKKSNPLRVVGCDNVLFLLNSYNVMKNLNAQSYFQQLQRVHKSLFFSRKGHSACQQEKNSPPVNTRLHMSRNSVGLFDPIHSPTFHQPIIIYFGRYKTH